MLPPFIIEQIRKREHEVLERERPVLQIPLPLPVHPDSEPSEDDDGEERGVVIIDV